MITLKLFNNKKERLLNHVQAYINQGNTSLALSTIYDGLNEIQKQSSLEEWKQYIEQYRQHPVSLFFLQDPFIRRAFEKPRGYAGDAIMLDFIYALDGITPPPFNGNESAIEKQLYYEFNSLSSACKAVRERRRILSQRIDETIGRTFKPHILSVGSGHLRELMDFSKNTIGHFVAIDQDKESLTVAGEILPSFGEMIPATVVDIVRGKIPISTFDFIYSAGLYDYLPDKFACKLTSKLFSHLNPGGRLLIANFLPSIPCRGMMEACGDWWLIFRNKAEMKNLMAEIPPSEIHHFDLFIEKNENIIFIEVEKI